MGKETVICIIIVVLILIGNYITQKYTDNSVTELSNSFIELKEDILKDEQNIDKENIKNKIKDIQNNWELKHNKLAYFIEHDELEKVETNMTSLKSFIEANEYTEAISELDKSIFVLKHIQEKYAFSLENVF